MSGFEDIVAAISSHLVSALASASYPALTTAFDGSTGIRLGRKAQRDLTAPPRVIFIPMRSSFDGKDIYNASNAATPFSASRLAQTQQRALLSERVTFEVRCWGVAGGSYATDYGATQALYRQVIASTWAICGAFTSGGVAAEGGTWVDAEEGSSQHVVNGAEFVFGLTFPMPVLGSPLLSAAATLPLADPATAKVTSTITMTDPSGKTGTGAA
jgi:hypothetical protein